MVYRGEIDIFPDLGVQTVCIHTVRNDAKKSLLLASKWSTRISAAFMIVKYLRIL